MEEKGALMLQQADLMGPDDPMLVLAKLDRCWMGPVVAVKTGGPVKGLPP